MVYPKDPHLRSGASRQSFSALQRSYQELKLQALRMQPIVKFCPNQVWRQSVGNWSNSGITENQIPDRNLIMRVLVDKIKKKA